MTQFNPIYLAAILPLFFVVLWFAITSLVGVMSGWFGLMRAYGDSDERPVLRLTWQSGSMGAGVAMNNLLRFEVCPSGLRLGLLRAFGPFCRDLFIPWPEISVTQRKMLGITFAVLSFRGRAFPTLTIRQKLADRLAGAAQGRFPQPIG